MTRIKSWLQRPAFLPTYTWVIAAIVAGTFLLFLLFLLFHDSHGGVVLIEPLVVSKKCVERGMTPQAVRQQLLDAIQAIETFAPPREERNRKKSEEAPTFVIEEVPITTIEIPATKISFGVVVNSMDRLLGHEPRRISGGIRILDPGEGPPNEKEKEKERFTVNLEIVDRGRGTPRTVEFVDSRDALVSHMAESAVRMIDPYHFALYRFRSGRDQDAVEIAREIISSQPHEARTMAAAWVLWGNVLARAGNLDGARVKYKEAVGSYARSAAGYYNWGVTLERQGKNDEAEKEYESSARAASHKAPIYLTWGELLEKEGKFDQALDKYRDAADADRTLAEAYYCSGQLLEKRGKLEQALVKYGQMTEADPRFVGGYYATGHLLEKLYRRTEAEAAYRKEIEIDPTAEISYDALAGALEKEGKDREAEEFYKYWVSVMPRSFAAYRGWSDLLRKQGRTEEAKEKRERSDKFLFEQIKP